VSSSEVSHPVLDEPLSSREIAEDARVLSFPLLAGYPISWPEQVALDRTWTPPAITPV
jgi:hypothetical protein